jgi:hypothetical protein
MRFLKGSVSMRQAERLLELASWYREFAERTKNPTIWNLRLRTAEDLEKAAARLSTPGIDEDRAGADREHCRLTVDRTLAH